MCGIAGFVQQGGDGRAGETLMRRFAQELRHRGPDDSGHFVSSEAGLALAHTRLAILDLSAAGHQPMSTPDGRYTISFNGEIYNFRQLRADLEQEGERFSTDCDTEVLVRLYARRGKAMLRDVQGMFAFGIWDRDERRLFLARDPLGIKPLYYALTSRGLFFASEIRALLASGAVPAKLNPDALEGYFLYGSVQEPETIVEGVCCLPAGHWMEWHEGKRQQQKYWDIEFGRSVACPSDPAGHVRAALAESLSRHFISDVPVGLFLSGGIDSTALMALAHVELGRTVQSISVAFRDPALNEGALAARTARQFGATHHECLMEAANGRVMLQDFLAAADQPSIDGFNTFCVARQARSLGLKVVLSGLGGDELFAGYPSFRTVPSMVRLGRRASVIGPLVRPISRLAAHLGRQPKWRRFGSYLAGYPSTGAAYWSMRGVFSRPEAKRLVQFYLGSGNNLNAATRYFGVTPQPTVADEVSVLELTRYMRNQLLRDSDVMSMACSLELRTPFVDQHFVDAISSIPAGIRLRPGKQLLLEAVPEIPPWIKERPKTGFVFPFEQWLKADWSDVLQQVDRRSPVPLFTWYRRWALFALENFMRRWKIESPALHI